MGIFTRFRDIVGSNINSMLDRAEDPEKLIRMMIQEMEDTLIELKAACAGVMADSKRVENQQAVNERRIEYWDDNAKLAVSKGREDLAREALIEKRLFVQRTEALTDELIAHQALLGQYQDDIRQLDEKLKSAREKERLLLQRHIYATRKKQAQQEIRRSGHAETIIKFDELENRIEQMEAEADLVNFGSKPNLTDELEKLALDDEVEQELRSLKAASPDQMEQRVEALETIIDNK